MMDIIEFAIKDDPRHESLAETVKRLARGEVPPPMPKSVEWSPRPFDMRFIDNLTREECQTVYERLLERGKQLRTADPLVYGVKRTWKSVTRYHTRVKGMGWRQLLASDLEHGALWLTAIRSVAEDNAKAMGKDRSCVLKDAVWEVFEIPKVEAVKLPCYKCHYGKRSEFVG
jgi:hypothetical protein